jgi:hypothetical protein
MCRMKMAGLLSLGFRLVHLENSMTILDSIGRLWPVQAVLDTLSGSCNGLAQALVTP